MNGISEEKYTHIDEIKEQTKAVFDELMKQAKLEEGDILVVGCSSSEIASHRIGSYSSVEIGEAVAQTFLNCCKEKKIYLAAQCCEHLNRAIIIEKTAAKEYRLPMVNVVPKKSRRFICDGCLCCTAGTCGSRGNSGSRWN